jgi:hypothetical protein
MLKSYKYIKARDDGRCPFCGTNVEMFSVCKGCGAERMVSLEPNDTVTEQYDLIYFIVGTTLLLYFRTNIIWFLDGLFFGFGEIPYFLFLFIFVFCLILQLNEFRHIKNFSGLGWKRRLK